MDVKKNRFIISGIFGMFLILTAGFMFVNSQSLEWTIDGDSVYIDDENVYINITPHTSNHPIIELRTKSFSGNIDVVVGFNTDEVIPKGASTNPHLENVTQSYTCNYEYNFTTSPNFAWCFTNTTTFDESNVSNGSLINMVLVRSFDSGNSETQTIFWDEEKIVWNDVAGAFSSANIDYLGYDKWYFKQGFNVNAGQTYKLKLDLQTNFGSSHKYFFGVKPSSQTLQESIDADTFYFIDPWTNNLNNELIGYWTLNGTSGPVNSSVGTIHGTNVGATTGATGKLDGAYDFEDSEGDYIKFGNNFNFAYDGTFSANAWINAETTIGSDTIMSKMDRTSPYMGWQVRLNSNDEIEFGYITDISDNEKTVESLPQINSTGTWYMVSVTYNNEVMKIYINGNEVETTENTNTLTSSFSNAGIEFNIGSRDNDESGDQDFDGLIDEVSIWERELSASEISDLYNSGTGITYAPNVSSNNAPKSLALIFPKNMTNSSSSTIEFQTLATDGEDATFSVGLIGNWTGSWVLNQTNGSAINNSQINFTIGIPDGTWLWMINATDSEGLTNFSVNYTFSVDTGLPFTALNQTNTTEVGASINFSLFVDDTNALEYYGTYIFSTNNNGTWVNDSAVNFTATPQWANVTKTLNNSLGNVVGFQWFIFDNARNTNGTDIFNITTTDGSNPTGTLGVNPPDANENASSTIIFEFKGNDNDAISHIEIWGNWSGSWASVYANTSYAKDTWVNISVSGINDGDGHVWGIFVNDSSGNVVWVGNRTLSIDSSFPSIATSVSDDQLILHEGGADPTLNIIYNITDAHWNYANYSVTLPNTTMHYINTSSIQNDKTEITLFDLGFYNWVIWANDTYGNFQQKSITFKLDLSSDISVGRGGYTIEVTDEKIIEGNIKIEKEELDWFQQNAKWLMVGGILFLLVMAGTRQKVIQVHSRRGR